jgi:hypothetical protein
MSLIKSTTCFLSLYNALQIEITQIILSFAIMNYPNLESTQFISVVYTALNFEEFLRILRNFKIKISKLFFYSIIILLFLLLLYFHVQSNITISYKNVLNRFNFSHLIKKCVIAYIVLYDQKYIVMPVNCQLLLTICSIPTLMLIFFDNKP